jgi:tripartite-type tricarboxylate transporter receptor subunit TctC
MKPAVGVTPAQAGASFRQQSDRYVSTRTQAIEYVRDGRLRALAVSSATRSEVWPDLPAVGESVPGYDASGWFGICAPAATPTAIIDKLNNEINASYADATGSWSFSVRSESN